MNYDLEINALLRGYTKEEIRQISADALALRIDKKWAENILPHADKEHKLYQHKLIWMSVVEAMKMNEFSNELNQKNKKRW